MRGRFGLEGTATGRAASDWSGLPKPPSSLAFKASGVGASSVSVGDLLLCPTAPQRARSLANI